METASKRDRTKEAALVQIGPPTAVIITGEWRAVVTLQIEMEESHKDTNFVHLRGTRMQTAEGFLSELAAVLQFPVWFGENWDALEDILRDRAAFAGTVIASTTPNSCSPTALPRTALTSLKRWKSATSTG